MQFLMLFVIIMKNIDYYNLHRKFQVHIIIIFE